MMAIIRITRKIKMNVFRFGISGTVAFGSVFMRRKANFVDLNKQVFIITITTTIIM